MNLEDLQPFSTSESRWSCSSQPSPVCQLENSTYTVPLGFGIGQALRSKRRTNGPRSSQIAIAHEVRATRSGRSVSPLTGNSETTNRLTPQPRTLIKALGLPEGNIPFGTFVIRYPAEKYQRIPVRKPVDVTWR